MGPRWSGAHAANAYARKRIRGHSRRGRRSNNYERAASFFVCVHSTPLEMTGLGFNCQ
jgi:hypothetical protein